MTKPTHAIVSKEYTPWRGHIVLRTGDATIALDTPDTIRVTLCSAYREPAIGEHILVSQYGREPDASYHQPLIDTIGT